MKKILLFSAFAILILSFSSCKKTVVSFTIVGNWNVDSYYENGVDNTTAFKATYVNYKINFDASNNYIETYTAAGINFTNAGPWKLINGGNDIQLTNQSDNTIRNFNIIEIKASSAKISENNGTKRYHLLKN